MAVKNKSINNAHSRVTKYFDDQEIKDFKVGLLFFVVLILFYWICKPSLIIGLTFMTAWSIAYDVYLGKTIFELFKSLLIMNFIIVMLYLISRKFVAYGLFGILLFMILLVSYQYYANWELFKKTMKMTETIMIGKPYEKFKKDEKVRIVLFDKTGRKSDKND